ncbi:MAG: 2'-5' RNA ligase family protein [Chitinispirillaceae bacterium]|nr:2'-5' RNA ligase family protein [Chitinispirillaceae bacterium]
MKRLAVDVVLLPPPRMTELAIAVNRGLARRYGKEIVFNRKNCLPHLSLCMGVLDEKKIPAVADILERIGKGSPPLRLTVTGLPAHTDSEGLSVSHFEIRKTASLQRLHETVMNKTAPFLTRKTTSAMLAPPPPYSRGTFAWIKNYPEESAYGNFRPHITVGFGEAEIRGLPFRFTASRLALCHLGNHCTCRKMLASAEFNS